MKMTKKVLGMVLCGVMTVGMITGCGGSDSSTTNDAGNTSADAAQEISIVSREDGSGTRDDRLVAETASVVDCHEG